MGGAPQDDEKEEESGPPYAEVSGEVWVFEDVVFSGPTPYSGPVSIQTLRDALLGGDSLIEADYTIFTTDLIPAGDDVWLLATALDNPLVLPTLSAHDTSSGAIRVPLVATTVLENILNTLSEPAELEAEAAQLVVRVVDSSGNGVRDVSASAASENVVYLDRGVWSDAVDQTDNSGYCLIYNVPALDFPGEGLTVVFGSTTSREWAIPFAAGVVTFATITLD